MRNVFFLILLMVITPCCIEEIDLNRDFALPRLVVEGTVSNKPGPYLVRLTESKTGKFIDPDFHSIDDAKGIKDAVIIISDNVNQADTLIPMVFNKDEYKFDYRYGRYFRVNYDNDGNIIDTTFWRYPTEFNYERGFYITRNLRGIPGRTYYLRITSGGKEYNASCYMPDVTRIDSVGYFKKVMEKDGQQYYVPLLYFAEPRDEKNYYLIQIVDDTHFRLFSETNWWFSILSDEFLESYINGLNVSLGSNPRNFEYPILMAGDSIYVGLSSITYDTYKYYESLLGQFKNDGGAYQLAPASPPTNISNGGLGFFRASSISEGRTKIPYSF